MLYFDWGRVYDAIYPLFRKLGESKLTITLHDAAAVAVCNCTRWRQLFEAEGKSDCFGGTNAINDPLMQFRILCQMQSFNGLLIYIWLCIAYVHDEEEYI